MLSRRSIHGLVAVVAVAAAIFATAAYAGKPSPYSPTLDVSWPVAAAPTSTSTSTPYVVDGCGYDSSYGGVTIVVYSPVAVGWSGQMPDGGGCISVSNFSTQGAGTYSIQAWQHVRHKDVVVASTSFSVP